MLEYASYIRSLMKTKRPKLRHFQSSDQSFDYDETDYDKAYNERVAAIRAKSSRLSPFVIEGTFVENHAYWDMKSEEEKSRIQLMLMAKDVVEWLVCEPIGSNEKLVSKMEHDILAYFLEAEKNGASERDILVAWNYVSTFLAGVYGRQFQVKVVDHVS